MIQLSIYTIKYNYILFEQVAKTTKLNSFKNKDSFRMVKMTLNF